MTEEVPRPPHLQPTPGHGAFRLTRYFSLASLLGLVAVMCALMWTYRQLTDRHIVSHEARDNTDLTQAFAQAVWPRFQSFIESSTPRSREQLAADPAVNALDAEVRNRLGGLKVVKVKIYNPQGITVYSSEARQIGEDRSTNRGFLEAMAGRTSSDITHRDRFDAFEGAINDRDLIASYIPFSDTPGRPPQAVFEVYSDVTGLLRQQRKAQWEVAGIVLCVLALLYLFLLMVVRKADRLMARHESERADREAEVRHQAFHDALTGLPNRAGFPQRLSEAMAQAQRHRRSLALMFVDLDRFKAVNDSLGHTAGDKVLKVAAGRIRDHLRESDQLFRMGGDEFIAILPESAGAHEVAAIAQRIIDSVSAPIALSGSDLAIGATVGIAMFPDDGSTPDELLRHADAAMYSAKSAGRGRHAFYQAAMNQRAQRRRQLEADLREGFRRGEFELYYQPRVDSHTRKPVAAEALLRWHCPQRGLVLAAEIVPVLEEGGLMNLVGAWILRTACRQMRQWQRDGAPIQRVSVNVSPRQFHSPGFDDQVALLLREVDLAPQALEIELTEASLIPNLTQAEAVRAALRRLGVRVTLDDFGAGASQLTTLRRFAPDYLKIDRSVIAQIDLHPRDRAMVRAIATLAAAEGIAVIAEGVETQRQANGLAGLCVAEMQGLLFGAPVPVAQLGLAGHMPNAQPEAAEPAEA